MPRLPIPETDDPSPRPNDPCGHPGLRAGRRDAASESAAPLRV